MKIVCNWAWLVGSFGEGRDVYGDDDDDGKRSFGEQTLFIECWIILVGKRRHALALGATVLMKSATLLGP